MLNKRKQNTNGARALGSSVVSCSSTDLKLKTHQPLVSDETEDWRLDSVWHQALICLFLIRLPLLLSTTFFHDNKEGLFKLCRPTKQ